MITWRQHMPGRDMVHLRSRYPAACRRRAWDKSWVPFHARRRQAAGLNSLPRSKLLQEPQIIPTELPDTAHPILAHHDPLRPHAERKTTEAHRIVAAVAQHHRMHHARAHDLDPAAALAQAAAGTGADDAIHVHLDRRL